MNQLAEIVDESLRQYCCIGSLVPRFHEDSDNLDYEQEGESLVDLLQEELEIDMGPAEDLAKILEDSDPAEPSDGGEPFYSIDQNYHRRHLSPWEYAQEWEDFSNRIKHERRFFDERARSQLAGILGESGSARAAALPVIEVGPGTRVESLYRARRADTDRAAAAMPRTPGDQLGPPLPAIATAGRMNPAGISVFYSALSEDTAIAEVRPSVGSLVVVGRFTPTCKLRLLDLSQIGVGFTGSIFHPEYEDRAARRRFLEGFHTLIAKPVQPLDEPLEYIPTQAVAEYVHNALGLDGILYASAQVGAVPEVPEPTLYVYIRKLTDEELGLHNVVLFGQAAIVQGSPGAQGDDLEWSDGVTTSARLTFAANSARAVRVTGVKYCHEWVFIPDHES